MVFSSTVIPVRGALFCFVACCWMLATVTTRYFGAIKLTFTRNRIVFSLPAPAAADAVHRTDWFPWSWSDAARAIMREFARLILEDKQHEADRGKRRTTNKTAGIYWQSRAP